MLVRIGKCAHGLNTVARLDASGLLGVDGRGGFRVGLQNFNEVAGLGVAVAFLCKSY